MKTSSKEGERIMDRPTTEEKCSHEFYEVLKRMDVPVKCAKCGVMIDDSPSPEARVDWGREAEIIINAIPADREDDYFQMAKTIIKNALSAAFEKGREAR